MKIGTFTKTEDGTFEGRIETLTFEADITLNPAGNKSSEKSPDFQITSANTGAEIGAGWNETSQKSGNPYISVKLDDPSFAYPIWAALTGSDTGEYILYWSRPKSKTGPETTSDAETL